MITNERQYLIGKAQVDKFRSAIDAPDTKARALHPRAQKALRDAAQSQLADLLAEVADYEQLRDEYKGVSVERLRAVADALKLRVREVITFEPL